MLNKEFLLPPKKVPSLYDNFHFVARMRVETTEHFVWDYSGDIKNVVGGRIPWWGNPNNFLKKVDLWSWTFIYQSNAPADVVAKNAGLSIQGYSPSGDNYGTVTTFDSIPLINLEGNNGVNVRFIEYLQKYILLCIKFTGTYTDKQGQEKSYEPTGYLYL